MTLREALAIPLPSDAVNDSEKRLLHHAYCHRADDWTFRVSEYEDNIRYGLDVYGPPTQIGCFYMPEKRCELFCETLDEVELSLTFEYLVCVSQGWICPQAIYD